MIFPNIQDQYRPVDITKGDLEIADVIVLRNNGEAFIRSIRSPNLLGIGNDTRLMLQEGDRIHVRVYCSNSEPSNELIIVYKKKFSFDNINKDSVNEYFEIIRKE